MELGIYQRLSADAGVIAALGAGEIYPVILPDELTGPSLSYQLISTVADYTLDGPVGFYKAKLQMDAWSTTYAGAKALAAAVLASLDGWAGVLPDSTRVLGIQLASMQDLYESEAQLYRVQQIWLVMYAAS